MQKNKIKKTTQHCLRRQKADNEGEILQCFTIPSSNLEKKKHTRFMEQVNSHTLIATYMSTGM